MKARITNEGRIRRAAFFMLLALAVEAGSLAWRHPLSFYLFAAVGAPLALLGVASFLLSLVAPPARKGKWGPVASPEPEEEPAQAVNG